MSPLRKGELDLAARPDDLVGRAFGEPESSPAFGMASDSSLRITFLILDEKESMHQILDCKFIDGTNAQTFGVPKTREPRSDNVYRASVKGLPIVCVCFRLRIEN